MLLQPFADCVLAADWGWDADVDVVGVWSFDSAGKPRAHSRSLCSAEATCLPSASASRRAQPVVVVGFCELRRPTNQQINKSTTTHLLRRVLVHYSDQRRLPSLLELVRPHLLLPLLSRMMDYRR